MGAANDNAEGKSCSKCLEWKPLTEFHTAKRKDGSRRFVAGCKACANAVKRRHAAKNLAAAVERVRLWRLLPGNMERKNAGERVRRKKPEVAAKHAEYSRAWKEENREVLNRRRRERNATDAEYREKRLAAQREYYSRPEVIEKHRAMRQQKNAEPAVKAKFNEYRRNRYASDPNFVCQSAISRMVNGVLSRTKQEKSDRSHAILGYSANMLRQRIECQFRPGMSWSNRSEWHIDHKKPVAEFIRQGITSPRTINALCNLQPLWAHENQAKSDTWPLEAANDNNKHGDLYAAA